MPDCIIASWGLGIVAPSPADRLNHAIDLGAERVKPTARGISWAIWRPACRTGMSRYPGWRRARGARRRHGDDVEMYRAVLALNPNRESTLLALGALLIDTGAPRDATMPLLRCCGLAPRNLDAWSTLGRAYMDAREPALALEAFTRARRSGAALDRA